MQRYVVLDIDNTLLHARPHDVEDKMVKDKRNFYICPSSIYTILKVTIRNHLNHFLDELYGRGYKVIVWSAGSPSYVKSIVSVIFSNRKVEYVFTSDHLTDGRKKLTTIEQVLPHVSIESLRLVDDNPDHARGQEKYVHVIPPFSVSPSGEDNDSVLLDLAEKLFL